MLGVLDRVEAALDVDLTKENVDALSARGDDWLEALWGALRLMPGQATYEMLPPLRSGDAEPLPRPYFPVSPVHGHGAVDLTLAPLNFRDPRQIEGGMAALARHLLYCGSVAVDDPMFWLTCDMVGELDADGRARLRGRRSEIVEGLRFLATTRPLIKEHRIVLVPYAQAIKQEMLTAPIDLDDLIRDEDVEAITDADVKEYTQHPYAQLATDKRLLLLGAMSQMEQQVRSSLYFGGRLDFSTEINLHQHALRTLLEEAPSDTEAARLRTLARLPGLALESNSKYLLDLAHGDEAFAGWRNGMKRALDKIGTLDPADHNFAKRAREMFRDELSQPVHDLGKAGRASSWKGIVVPRVEDLTFNAVALGATLSAAVALGVSATPIGAAGIAVATLSRTLYTFARGRGARNQAEAITELYDELGGSNQASNPALRVSREKKP